MAFLKRSAGLHRGPLPQGAVLGAGLAWGTDTQAPCAWLGRSATGPRFKVVARMPKKKKKKAPTTGDTIVHDWSLELSSLRSKHNVGRRAARK